MDTGWVRWGRGRNTDSNCDSHDCGNDNFGDDDDDDDVDDDDDDDGAWD